MDKIIFGDTAPEIARWEDAVDVIAIAVSCSDAILLHLDGPALHTAQRARDNLSALWSQLYDDGHTYVDRLRQAYDDLWHVSLDQGFASAEFSRGRAYYFAMRRLGEILGHEDKGINFA